MKYLLIVVISLLPTLANAGWFGDSNVDIMKEQIKGIAKDPESVIFKEITEKKSGDVCAFVNARNLFGGYGNWMTAVYVAKTGIVYYGPTAQDRNPSDEKDVRFGKLVEKHCS